MDNLIARLASHWKLPPIQVCLDTLPAADLLLAQARIARLAAACEYHLLGYLAVAATLLLGAFNIIMQWGASRGFLWGALWDIGWLDLGKLVLLSLGAGVIGKTIAILWTRGRLLLELLRWRRKLRALERGT